MNISGNGAGGILFFLTLLLFVYGRGEAQTAVPSAHRLEGTVVDRKSGKPVPEAVISVKPQNDVVYGDTEGKFRVELPQASACTLTVDKSGFKSVEIPIETFGEKRFITVVLEPAGITELQKLTVTAGRSSLKSSENVSQLTISPELAEKLPAVGQEDVFRTLQLLPGISGTNESSSALFVRGGTPDQNLIYLDGMPIYYVDHFYGFYSAFNPWAIDEISIHKGGFGPQWGGRLSSVVEISSIGKKKPYRQDGRGAKAAIGVGSLSSKGFLQLPVVNHDIGTVMITGRRSMTDLYRTGLFNDLFDRLHGSDTTDAEYNASEFGPRPPGTTSGSTIVYEPKVTFWDVNGLAALRLGSRGTLTTSFFMSRDEQDNSLDTSAYSMTVNVQTVGWTDSGPPIMRFDTISTTKAIDDNAVSSWGNLCIGEEWKQEWSDKFGSSLNLSYSSFTDKQDDEYLRSQTESHRFNDTTAPYDSVQATMSWLISRNKIDDISCKFDNRFKLTDWNTLRAGLEGSLKSVVYERDSVQPDTNSLEWRSTPPFLRQQTAPVNSHDSGVSVAVYVGDDMTFNEKAGLSLGGRFYYFNLARTYAIDPRISGWWKPIPDLKVKGAWGMYTQEIHRAEKDDIIGGSKFVWLLATKERPLEKSQHYIGGISWEKNHFLFDVEAYYKRLSGLLSVSERPPITWQVQEHFNPDDLLLYEGTGIGKGIEFLAQIKDAVLPILSGKLRYNGWLAYTLSSIQHTYDVFNNGNPFPATLDRPHEVKLVNSLKWNMAEWSSLNIGAIWLYSTGTPYTAPLAKYSIMMMDSLMRLDMSHVSGKNGYRLPDYHRLDLSVTWKVLIGKHLEGKLSLGFFNVYNHENVLERTFVEEYLHQIVYSPSLNREPIIRYNAIEKRSIMFQFHPSLTIRATF